MALRDYPQIDKLFLVGDTPQIEAELKKHQLQRPPDRDRPFDPGRRNERSARSNPSGGKRISSVSRAVDLGEKGEAAAIVSAGHTGAAVAATTIKLRTLRESIVPASPPSFPRKRISLS